jgi:hypothetical protein
VWYHASGCIQTPEIFFTIFSVRVETFFFALEIDDWIRGSRWLRGSKRIEITSLICRLSCCTSSCCWRSSCSVIVIWCRPSQWRWPDQSTKKYPNFKINQVL